MPVGWLGETVPDVGLHIQSRDDDGSLDVLQCRVVESVARAARTCCLLARGRQSLDMLGDGNIMSDVDTENVQVATALNCGQWRWFRDMCVVSACTAVSKETLLSVSVKLAFTSGVIPR